LRLKEGTTLMQEAQLGGGEKVGVLLSAKKKERKKTVWDGIGPQSPLEPVLASKVKF